MTITRRTAATAGNGSGLGGRVRLAVTAAITVPAIAAAGLVGWNVLGPKPENGLGAGEASDGEPGRRSSLIAPSLLASQWQTWAAWQEVDGNVESIALLQPSMDGEAGYTSVAFGGADAVVQDYVDTEDRSRTVRLRAVAAMAPRYFVSAGESAEAIGTDLARREVITVGTDECSVARSDMSAPDEPESAYTECLRTGPGLTVWIEAPRMLAEEAAALLADAWDQMGGGESGGSWPVADRAAETITAPSTLAADLVSDDPKVAVLAELNAADADRLSSAYGGAQAHVRTYVTAGAGTEIVTLRAVRSDSPLPRVRYVDLERAELLAPNLELQHLPTGVTGSGDVYCTVQNFSVRPDGDRADLSPQVLECFRTGDGLTVWLAFISDEAPDDVRRAATMTADTWEFIARSER